MLPAQLEIVDIYCGSGRFGDSPAKGCKGRTVRCISPQS
jgi:hypothetical protein